MWLIKTIDGGEVRGLKFEVGYYDSGVSRKWWYCYESFQSNKDAEKFCNYLNGGSGMPYAGMQGTQVISNHSD
ncbi:MAG TPA: hypothetical protein VEP90_11175 [Methylomirabilota bacterium]|nr:hypothetical protein [Methylomirabilota bacterium]